MKKVEDYRAHAAECRAMANRTLLGRCTVNTFAKDHLRCDIATALHSVQTPDFAPMSKHPADDPQIFWSKAAETRAMADRLVDPHNRRILLQVAKTYEMLARRAESL